jgi:hypothetical protein
MAPKTSATTIAQTMTYNQSCTPAHDRLNPSTYHYESDCDALSFCSSDATCVPRQCRRPGTMPHLATSATNPPPPPPLCPPNTYCPDNGSTCLPQLTSGAPCEFARDDQCSPPPGDTADLSDTYNARGAICLHSSCTYANAAQGEPCSYELTAYNTSTPTPDGLMLGDVFVNTIVRDNCLTASLFCSTQTNVCEERRDIGDACSYHRDCLSVSTHQPLHLENDLMIGSISVSETSVRWPQKHLSPFRLGNTPQQASASSLVSKVSSGEFFHNHKRLQL